MTESTRSGWRIERDRIGPVKVGQSPDEVLRHLGEPRDVHGGGSLTFHEYGDITITFQDGSVSMVIVQDEFPGRTVEGIGVGTLLDEVVGKVGPLSYDSEMSLWTFDGGGRLYLELARPVRPGEHSTDPPWYPQAYSPDAPSSTIIRRIYLI
jgi:hypothetical protein